MNMYSKEILIGVMEFIEGWQMFCIANDKRVIFFKTLKTRVLPTYSRTIVSVIRAGHEYSQGIFYMTGGHIETGVSTGLEEIIPKEKIPGEAGGLQSYWFQKGDKIFIKSDGWLNENLIDDMVTKRAVGTPFTKVFESDPGLANYIADLLSVSTDSLQDKTVVMETSTGSIKFNEFF